MRIYKCLRLFGVCIVCSWSNINVQYLHESACARWFWFSYFFIRILAEDVCVWVKCMYKFLDTERQKLDGISLFGYVCNELCAIVQYFLIITVWFAENVHASIVVDAVGATDCGHFIATRQIKWIPCE